MTARTSLSAPLSARRIPLSKGIWLWALAWTTTTAPVAADEPLRFSVERGFYRDPFPLEITTSPPGGHFLFTLDGTDPRTSATAQRATAPFSLDIDPFDFTNRDQAPGVTLRAAPAGNPLAKVITHTYLFLNHVKDLSPQEQAPGPGWAPPYDKDDQQQRIDYGMDPEVLLNPRYRDQIETALSAVPTVSLVTDIAHIFSPETGIYLNALKRGRAWERPVSVELLNPDGTAGFQIDAGLRLRGGFSRNNFNPKHAFRLFFRSEYGQAKLKYPLFGAEGADSFDKIDLRTSQNYAWSRGWARPDLNLMNRDVFSRDTQRDMGRPYTRSRYYHLYINGTYWGLFQTQERAEAAFAASYFGGQRADYDVIKVDPSTFNWHIEATDGDMEAWRQVWQLCEAGLASDANYYALQGLDPDGRPNPARPTLVDVGNLIDYMLVIFYGGNFDAPVSKFLNNEKPNNFYAIYDRSGQNGFRFFAHDAEHTLLLEAISPGSGLEENRVAIGAADNDPTMVVRSFDDFHPQWLHHRLSDHPDYRARFAEHVQKHFFGDGALTPAANSARFQSRAAEIQTAIIGESARWGDFGKSTAATQEDWQRGIDNVINNYFPQRSAIVLQQLKAAALFPNLGQPLFFSDQQLLDRPVLKVSGPYDLTLVNPNSAGVLLYTLDGTDPRMPGGLAKPEALEGADAPLTLLSTTRISARIKSYLLVPEEDLVLLGPSSGQTWTVTAADGALPPDFAQSIPPGHSGNAAAFRTIPRSRLAPWSIKLSTSQPAGGYIGLHFALHTGGSRGQGFDFLSIAVNGKSLNLGGNFLDLAEPNWQSVDLPLDNFDINTPVHTVVFNGNLAGTIYLDDIRLVPPANTGDPAPALWSTLRQLTLVVDQDRSALYVSEVHYHPLADDTSDERLLEFIELHNAGTTPVDLSLAVFDQGINYTFPAGTALAPNAYLVLAADQAAFTQRYGFVPFGQYNGRLANSGEEIALNTAAGDPILNLTYNDKAPWPEAADGDGFSLVPIRLTNPNDPGNWRLSAQVHGSPGRMDKGPTAVTPTPGAQMPFALAQNYPNPFNSHTVFSFSIPQTSPVSLRIYDLLGQVVATLIDRPMTVGAHTVNWRTEHLAAGVYFYRLVTDQQTATRKLLLLK